MRTLKFRAWDKKVTKMWPLADVDSEHSCCYFAYDMAGNRSEADMEEDIVLMQFTGLLDKNGKEIYEGDYIQFTDLHGHKVNCTCEHCFRLELGTIAEVRWMDDGFMLVNPKASKSQCACAAMGRLFSENHEVPVGFYAEVIGNIYENPDLIKE